MIDIKNLVREKYGKIAENANYESASGCCGTNCCDTIDYVVFADDYSKLVGYNKDADLGLGCGLPTEFAKIKKGDTVIDLGSGVGNDCFVASAATGENGRVIGLDFTDNMIKKAKENAAKFGFNNIEFIEGDIENMPISDETADVVVSNCVLNLVPDKRRAFAETFRILKHGGHFSISDVVIEGEMPERLQHDAEMYAGCVSGAIQKSEYLDIVRDSGFVNIEIQKDKKINLPDEILIKYADIDKISDLRNKLGIYSITLYAEKN